MYKLRTVDIWDTLLRRNCHPECIKLETARHLFLGWRDQILPEYRDSWTLYDARIKEEQALAKLASLKGKDNEYEITDVLSRWTDTVFLDRAPADLPLHLAEFELSVEIDRSSVDSGISFILSYYKAEKTIYLSDFYMGSGMLTRLLSSKGLDTLVSEGISSCDVGLNKRSGRLFKHVHSVYSVFPEQHVHIGDNEWSDVASPRALGISAVHYLPEPAHTERLTKEGLFSSRDALFYHINSQCSSTTKSAAQVLSKKQRTALILGSKAAPLFFGFAHWIAEQAILQNLDKLYFFTREGEFFYAVYRALFPDGHLSGHKLPPATVLAVSRLSTFAASMREPSIREMSRIWDLFRVQSVSGLFSTLGLSVTEFSRILETLGIKRTDIIDDPKNNPKLNRLFMTPTFTDAVKRTLMRQANLLQHYLIQSGIKSGDRIGIVDIGWRGTIQDNIAILMPDTHFHGMYLGLRQFVNKQPNNTSKDAYGPNENTSREAIALFTNFSAMEMLCNSPNGSVTGYTRKDGQTIPIRQIDCEENSSHKEFIAPFQKGVILATKHWQPYLASYVVSSHELRDLALNIWDTLRRTPSEDLVDVYLHTPQHDIFGYGEVFNRCRYPSLSTILLSPFWATRRRRLINFIRRVQWDEAIKHAKDIHPIHRFLLLLSFRAANIVKRARFRI